MSSYWGADGKVVDGRFELVGGIGTEGIANFVLNTQGTLLASAARTTNTVSPNQTNYNARGIYLFLNITVASGTGGIRPIIQGIDPVTGNILTLHPTPTGILAVGLYGYELYPGASVAGVAGNTETQQHMAASLPRTWRAIVNHIDASSYTYSLGYQLVI